MGQGGGKGQRHYSKHRPQADCLKNGKCRASKEWRREGKREKTEEQNQFCFCLFVFWKCEAPRAPRSGGLDEGSSLCPVTSFLGALKLPACKMKKRKPEEREVHSGWEVFWESGPCWHPRNPQQPHDLYLAVAWTLFRTFRRWHGTWLSYKLKMVLGWPWIHPFAQSVLNCSRVLPAGGADGSLSRQNQTEILSELSQSTQLVSFCLLFIKRGDAFETWSFLSAVHNWRNWILRIAQHESSLQWLWRVRAHFSSFVLQMRKQILKALKKSLWVAKLKTNTLRCLTPGQWSKETVGYVA